MITHREWIRVIVFRKSTKSSELTAGMSQSVDVPLISEIGYLSDGVLGSISNFLTEPPESAQPQKDFINYLESRLENKSWQCQNGSDWIDADTLANNLFGIEEYGAPEDKSL